MRGEKGEVWGQAIRLARALDDANTVGNDAAAKLYGAQLLEKLKQLLEMYNG